MASQYQIPSTPRIISPSPTPSEQSGVDGYFPQQARSKAQRQSSVEPIEEQEPDGDSGYDEEEHPDLARARSKSRSPQVKRHPPRRMGKNGSISSATVLIPDATRSRKATDKQTNGTTTTRPNLLSPESAYPQGYGAAYWRSLSRSPSPLGLIPIHREWRAFIHKHEVPRKLLHVSIGFVILYFYFAGYQQADFTTLLLSLFIPIFTVDLVRFRWPAFNHVYIRVLGPFMRESEAHDTFNGVISYIAGLWATLYFCRKDVAVVSILLLSWCDPAASTFGRAWGKYTPRIRRGKSLAGSLAAFGVGVAVAVWFWGFVAPGGWEMEKNQGVNGFAFQGRLESSWGVLEGWPAVGVLALVTGLAASGKPSNLDPAIMLTVKRQTSTTVLYTVSTRAPVVTWTARASQSGLLLARLLAGIFVLALLLNEYSRVFRWPQNLPGLSSVLAISPTHNTLAFWFTHTLPWYYRATLTAVMSWLIFTKSHLEESLLVIRGLGVQTSTSSPSYLWTSSTRFIPTSSIQDILIHEAFRGFEVRYYLSIVVEDEEDVVVVFPVSLHMSC
ncbi:Diacylglycerol kinase [Friedmanniomyces endolithicus]|nr:Diacylglycerol kinase [Friedmanniomyces endolithicus]